MGRGRNFARRAGFVIASTVIVVVSSEKLYWYPQGFPRLDNLELLAVYSIGVLAFFMAIRRFALGNLPAVILGSAVFSLVVEGAVTPVMYEDGPFPFLALYFLGWHGLLSVVLTWYGIRRLALERRSRDMALLVVAWGLIVGLWSTVYWSEAQISEMQADTEIVWDLGQWSVSRFGTYMVVITVILIVAHLVLDRMWIDDWKITRTGGRIVLGLVILGVGVWTLVVFYAPIKFALFAWVVKWLLDRSTHGGQSSDVTVFEKLSGSARPTDFAPVALLAPSAVGAYGAMTLISPADGTLDIVYWVIVSATLIAGTGAIIWAVRNRASGPISAA